MSVEEVMTDTSKPDQVRRVTARVKWFSKKKDFGFVVCMPDADEALLHGNVLRSFGLGSITNGCEIVADVAQGERGLQVKAIESISQPDGTAIATADLSGFSSDDFQPARVKWYNPSDGYGFVTVHKTSADILIRAATLAEYGIDILHTGEAVSVVVRQDDRGAVVEAIADWSHFL